MALKENSLRQDLHETPAFHIRGNDDENEEWHPERRLREGWPTSSVLFKVYHQAMRRIAERSIIQMSEGEDMEVGITWIQVPGDKLPDAGLTEVQPNEDSGLGMVKGVKRRKENPGKKEETPSLLEQNPERGRKEVVGIENNGAGKRQTEKHD